MDPQIKLKPIDTSLKGLMQAALKDVRYEFGPELENDLNKKWVAAPPKDQKQIDLDVQVITKKQMAWFTFAVTQHGNQLLDLAW